MQAECRLLVDGTTDFQATNRCQKKPTQLPQGTNTTKLVGRIGHAGARTLPWSASPRLDPPGIRPFAPSSLDLGPAQELPGAGV
jgi:hypothetical protein